MSSKLITYSIVIQLLAGCSADGDKSGESGDTGSEMTYSYDDADRDGIIDGHDGYEDPDMDGKQNFEDPDSDGDGILDRLESGDADVMSCPSAPTCQTRRRTARRVASEGGGRDLRTRLVMRPHV